MKRTVSRMGNSSLVMSLPSAWVRENNVKAGDEVNVESFEKGLTVSLSQIHKSEKALEMDVSSYSKRSLMHLLNNAYRTGYVRFTLHHPTKAQRQFINDFTSTNLLGFEVVEENQTKMIIENIAEPSTDKTDIILRKVFLITKQMAELVYQDISSNSFTNLETITKFKETIDSFTNFTRRTILGVSYGGKEQSYFLFTFIAKFSVLAHTYYYFYKDVCDKKRNHKPFINEPKIFMDVITRTNLGVTLLYDVFYKKDLSKLNELDNLRWDVYSQIQTFLVKNKGFDNQFLPYFFELARHIQVASTYLVGYQFSSQMKF
ncbi:phosphate uptake regulator PhoU [Candidatus Woesearchaeota archaeon]|nr:phosphate uptake regulator PhoU [Candidatus Woesearchaeota archaeon]